MPSPIVSGTVDNTAINDDIYDDIVDESELDEIELDEIYEINDDLGLQFEYWRHRIDSAIPEEDEDECDV